MKPTLLTLAASNPATAGETLFWFLGLLCIAFILIAFLPKN